MATTTKLTGKQIEIATKVGKAIAKCVYELSEPSKLHPF